MTPSSSGSSFGDQTTVLDTSPAGQAEIPRRKAPSRRLVFGIVAVPLFMTAVDISIVATALPAIHKSLHSSINWAGWVITIYGLGMIVALPIAGKLSDQFGRRRVFLYGVALFTVSSLFCGLSTNIYMLIILRACQALGGGALQPSAVGIIADHFGKDRDRAIGQFGNITASGQTVGPVFGGIFVAYLSWRWIYFVNVPIGAVLFVLVARYIPESRGATHSRIDIRGLMLMSSCILAAAIFGITMLGERGTAIYAPTFIVPEVVAAVLLMLALRNAKFAEAPFIPTRFLWSKGFGAVNAVNFLQGAFGFGLVALLPLYAEQRFGLHPLEAGTLLTARAIGMTALGIIAALHLRRTGYRLPMMMGYGVIALGMLLLSVAARWGIDDAVWLSVGAAISGCGIGISNPASRNACLELAPEHAATISGLRSMFVYIGIILMVSINTAVLNRTNTPGITEAHVYWVVAGVVAFIMIPLARRIPDHKGSW